MDSVLQKAFSAEDFRKEAHLLVDLLAEYLEQTKEGKQKEVINYLPPEQLLSFWEKDLQEARGLTLEDFFQKLLKFNMRQHHPRYLGHQVAVPPPVNALTDFLSSFLNTALGVYEMGNSANCIEKIVIEEICKYIPYDQKADGIITSGGSLGNLTALLTARAVNAGYDVWQEGNRHQQLALMVSEEAHYCVDRAVKIMGWGQAGIIKIPVDNLYRMRVDLLEKYFEQSRMEGKKVIAVVASACSTSTGSFDSIDEIADFCEASQLWLHVDAAHGGGAIFSEKYRTLLKGIHRADSVIIDLHKMLLTSNLATALIYKNGKHAFQTFTQKADYLFEQHLEEDWFNMGKRTFECTKPAQGLRFYSILRTYGPELFETYLNGLFDLGKTFARLIAEQDDFELALEPFCNIVCFRYYALHLNDEKLDQVNQRIRQQLIEEGEFYIVQTRLRNRTYLRTTLMNPSTQPETLQDLLKRLRALALS